MICLLALSASSGLRAQDPTAEEFSSREAILQRLAEVRSELADLDPAVKASEGKLLLDLEATLVQHREALDYLERMVREAQEARQAVQAWRGFDQPGPHSIREAEQIRAAQLLAAAPVRRRRLPIRLISGAIEDVSNQLAERQQAERRHLEQAGTAASAEARRVALASAREQQLHSRILAERLGQFGLRRDSQSAQRDAVDAALELSRLQIEAVKGKVEFAADELQEIQAQIAAERNALMQAASAEEQHGARTGHLENRAAGHGQY
jgi:hypothetical protein